MIVWLASYPKSGNTWLRSIISSLIYSNDGIFSFELLKKIDQFPEKKYFKDLVKNFSFDEVKKNWILAQDRINLDNKIKFFKTHGGKYTVNGDNFTNNENTIATIYIVRDPRTVIRSISHHYTLSMDESFEFMNSPQVTGNEKNYEEKKFGILNLLGKWNDHYRSWSKNKKDFLLIRYEDLISEPLVQINKIILFLKNYIQFESDENKVNNILKSTSFENLKKMETENSFEENAYNKKSKIKLNFFNLGPDNKWQNNLDKKIREKIETSFKNEMIELKYL